MLSDRLKETTYNFMPDINPAWTRIQRVPGVLTGNHMKFDARRPIPRSFLSSRAYIKWTVNITKLEGTGNAFNPANFFTFDDQAIFLKPFMLLANSTKTATLKLNGYGMTYNEPQFWSKYLGHMFATRQDYEGGFTTSGAPMPKFTGAYNFEFLNFTQGAANPGTNRTDPNIDVALDMAYQRYKSGVDEDAKQTENNADFDFLDPLYFGIFNPFYDTKGTLPETSWYKNTSNTIPYIHELELDITLHSIAANCLQFAFGQKADAVLNECRLGQESLVTAELVLEWIVPHEPVKLPPTIDIPSWEVDFKSFEINNGAPILDVFDVGVPTSISTPYIHYHQVPSWILIAGVRDKNKPNYLCSAIRTNNAAATQGVFSRDKNSWEPSLKFDDITITVDVNNRKVDTNWDSRDIFSITKRNCNKLPFNYSSFLGGNKQYSEQPGNSFLLLRPDDLSIKQSTGVLRRDFTLQIDANLRTSTGYSISGGVGAGNALLGNYEYTLMVVTFYDQTLITLGKERKVEKRLFTQFI